MDREKLIAARTRKHWTQPEAAEVIGCDVTALNRWEKGKSTPHAYNIQRLCDAYGQSAQALGLEKVSEWSGSSEDAQPSSELRSMIGMDLTMRLMSIVFLPHRRYQIKQDEITRLIQEDIEMKNNAVTRREALRRVATLPLMTLGLGTPIQTQQAPEEVINQCATGITSCWHLSKGSDESDLHLAFSGASSYLPALKQVMHTSAKYRKDAATLAGQSALLKTVLGWNLEGLRPAASYANEAASLAQESGDIALQITALDFLGWIYYYGNQNALADHVTGQAMLLLKQHASSLPSTLKSRIYGTRALIRAKNEHKSDGVLLGRASEHFFSDIEGPDLLYLDYDQASMIQVDALSHYHGGNQDNAMSSFHQMLDEKTLKPKLPQSERTRIETLSLMAMSSLKRPERDMEETIHYWRAAMGGARTLQSELRFNEAMTAYHVMDALWSGDPRVRELQDLAVHW